MSIFLGLIGIVVSFLLIKYREMIGDMLGEADWMHFVGGSRGAVLIVALLIFFWSIASMTGTQDMFLAPILWLIPGGRQQPVDAF